MNTNEPTTICQRCGIELKDGEEYICNVCYGELQIEAADRLESQEKTIAELTARAESAERERDYLAENYVPQRCSTCGHSTGTGCATQGKGCEWKWNGLPQEGEGE